jgi:hypothetical protein
MLWFLLLLSCQRQYLAIPGATPMDGYDLNVSTQVAPGWSIVEGAIPDEVDESFTLDIPLDASWSFELTEVVFTVWITETLSYVEYWVYEIQPEEREEGHAYIEVMLTRRPPSPEICSPWHVGTRVCYAGVRQGIHTTSFFLSSGDGGDSSLGTEVPISLEPLTAGWGSAAAQCQTFEDCCGCTWDPGLGTNICPIECYEAPECGCPTGTSDRGDGPSGTITCECPA